jgi:hypothetical protein
MLAASTVIKDVCCCAKNVKLTSKESSSKDRQNERIGQKSNLLFQLYLQ